MTTAPIALPVERFMDGIDAGTTAWQWIEEIAVKARDTRRGRAPAALHIDTPAPNGETQVIALYDGTTLLAVTTVFRDPMNFAMLIRWQAGDAG